MFHIKKFILALALASIGTTMWAAEDSLYLTFKYTDGSVTQIEIPFPEQSAVAFPTMKFTEKTMEISIPSEKEGEEPKIHTIGIAELENSTFDSTTSSIENAVLNNSTVFSLIGDNSLRIVSTDDNIQAADVRVYDVAGRSQNVALEIDGNSATVSLNGLNTGIYIVNYKNNSIKVTKR